MIGGLPELAANDDGFAALAQRLEALPAQEILRAALTECWAGRIVLVSSFGAEAAVLLHLASQVDPAVPVVFLNTGRLFGETLRYRDTLVQRLGLTQVKEVKPDAGEVTAVDADAVGRADVLFRSSPAPFCGSFF